MERAILHCDLNNFFASVEIHDNPQLSPYPVAVCGKTEDRHGIVLAKNELAKKFGVKTAEPIWQAKKKCPQLVTVPPHFEKYVQASKQIQEIYLRFTDQVEPFSIDECWLDVTGSQRLFGSGYEIAEKLRSIVKEETGLTISVGVSFNKTFAKLASDLKKPDATTVILKENYQEKVWQLPVNYMLGVGKATEKCLRNMGISTIGQLACTKFEYVASTLGKSGYQLWQNANGVDPSPVLNFLEEEPPKSVGNSITCTRDLQNEEEVWHVFLYLAEKISKRMRADNFLTSTIQITIKDSQLKTKQIQQQLEWPTRLSDDLAKAAQNLFLQNYSWKHSVRALGICASSLLPDNCIQQSCFFHDASKDEKKEELESKIESVCGKFGKGAVVRASFLEDFPIPTVKSDDMELGQKNKVE